jgi:hypothetical protein
MIAIGIQRNTDGPLNPLAMEPEYNQLEIGRVSQRFHDVFGMVGEDVILVLRVNRQ